MLHKEDNDLRRRLLDYDEDNEESSPATVGLVENNNNNNDDDPTPKKKKTKTKNNNNNRAFAFLAALFSIFFLRFYYTKAIYNNTIIHTKEDRKQQRIVILAGPAYAPAGTNLLKSFYRFAGQTVWLDPAYEPELSKDPPHPVISGWSYPVGVREEYRSLPDWPQNEVVGKNFFHSPLHEIMAGPQRSEIAFRTQFRYASEQLLEMTGYYRDLFRVPWSEGKSLVLGIENLAWLFREAEQPSTANSNSSSSNSSAGEAKHIDPLAEQMLDRLLDVLTVWDDKNHQTITRSSPWPEDAPDIEVVIDYRTPRIDDAVSIWKRFRRNDEFSSFRDWLTEGHNYLHHINAMGLALQLVRRGGIRVTLVDSTAAAASASANNDKQEDHYVVATPLEGIVACDILGITATNHPETTTTETKATATATTTFEGPIRTAHCDAQSRLHLPRVPQKRSPTPKVLADPGPRNITPGEMELLESILQEYDCGIWKYLRAYKAKGLLRVLPAGENPFENCPPNNDDDDAGYYETPSFTDTIQKIINYARTGSVTGVVEIWADTYNNPEPQSSESEETGKSEDYEEYPREDERETA